MKVTETIPIKKQHSIEFGISTWAENDPEPEQEESVRNRYENLDGVFSPHGSSEIPIQDMELLVSACLDRDKFEEREILEIMIKCVESLKRIKG